MKTQAIVIALLLTLPAYGSVESQETNQHSDKVGQQLRLQLPENRTSVDLPELKLSPLRERLMQSPNVRAGSFGNSRVDLAPKSWPYPMVVSPGRPVLPGSAW